MHDPNQDLIEAALRLPGPVRADLAAVLLASIGPDVEVEGETDVEIGADELRRRLAEARADPGASLSWAELRDNG
jgi:hypothetical protein